MLERPEVKPSDFAEKSRCWEGNTMVGDFERLAQEFVNPEAVLQYRICGGQDARGRPRLHCTVKGDLEMLCQRCLKPVDVAVESDRLLYLAASEEEAERLESVLADEEIDVMVTGQTLDLAGVVEDEVLLSLPIVPMHDVCDMASAVDV
jgi:uncharacterized protein